MKEAVDAKNAKNENESAIAVGLASSDTEKIDKVLKKVYIAQEDIQKMKRLVSLFGDEIGDSPKEIDVLSFFFEKSFRHFLQSGVIEEKIAQIKG